jgi:hypothetical protein
MLSVVRKAPKCRSGGIVDGASVDRSAALERRFASLVHDKPARYRWAMKALLALTTVAALSGCALISNECNLMGCTGSAEVAFIDAHDNAVAPSGELRRVGDASTQSFDCSVTSRFVTSEADCADGVLFLGYVADGKERFEVRFALDAGGWSPWREVPLELEAYTDPNFNGPGCACTSYDGTAEPVVVPDDAL